MPASVDNGGLNRVPVKPAIRTTQFWLLAGVLLLVAASVFDDKLDAKVLALVGPIAALLYTIIREKIYQDAAEHPNNALDVLLTTILDALHQPSADDATKVIAALKPIAVLPALAPVLAPIPTTDATKLPAGVFNPPASTSTVAALAIFGASLFFCTGCSQSQQTPYYISGVTANVDASKDGRGLSGGAVGVQFSPNPYYPLPTQKGLAK